MTRVAALSTVLCLLLTTGVAGGRTGGSQREPARNGLTLVLWLDVTISTTEAMSYFLWDDNAPTDGIFRGSKTPATLGDAFSRAVREGFVQRLQADDRARIGSVAKTRKLSAPFVSDRAALGRALRDALDVAHEDRYGPTPLWDAVDEGITALASQAGRRAVILVTDGMATGNRHALDDVIQRASDEGVSLSVVSETWGMPRSNLTRYHMTDRTGSTWNLMRSSFGKPPETNLQKLTDMTGGVFVSDGEQGQSPDPGARLTQILSELRRRPRG